MHFNLCVYKQAPQVCVVVQACGALRLCDVMPFSLYESPREGMM